MRYDLDLFRRLNDEYRSKPLVPKARSYDAESVSKWGRQRAEYLVKRFGIEGYRVLEIGCGRGEVIEALARHHGCEAVGVEVTGYAEQSQRSDVRIELIDLSLEDGSHLGTFDFIFSLTVWEHARHPFSLLKATTQRLKSDGRFYLYANLFRGPKASHRYRDIFFPWPHLLFADEVVEDYYTSIGLPPRRSAWVNRLSVADYLRYFDIAGFDVEKLWYSITPIDEEFYRRFEEKLSRYPRFDLERDFLHAVLKHRSLPPAASTAKSEAHPTPADTMAEAPSHSPPRDHRRDRIAQAYLGLWGSPEMQARARRRIHWMAENALGPRVLDIGCSEGILGVLLAREGFEVVGIDVNGDAIAYANDLRSQEHEATAQRLRFLVSDVTALPEALEPFDTVFLGEILEHVCQPQILLARAHELLRPGGRLVVTTPFGYFPHPDHKHEFRASQLAETVGNYFNIESFGIRDGYARIMAHRRGVGHEGERTVGPDALLREVEEAASELQRQHYVLDRRLVEAEREMGKLQEQVRDAERRLDARHRDYAVAVTELGFARRRNDELAHKVEEFEAVLGPTKPRRGTFKKKGRRSAVVRGLRWALKAPKKLLARARRPRAVRQPSSGAPGTSP